MAELWLNGEFCAEDGAYVSVHERGFLLGEAAFETMRATDGRLRRWSRHVQRLREGLAFLGLPEPDFDAIAKAAVSLSRRNQVIDGVARLTVSGGPHGGGVMRREDAKPTMVLTLRPRPRPPATVRLALLEGVRRGGLMSERYKLAGYGESIAARRHAQALDADLAVLRGPSGQAVCADSANLFWVGSDGVLFTPSLEDGALAGTTRSVLVSAASAEGLEIKDASAASPLENAVAAAVTNAVMGVVPVSQVNRRSLDALHPLIRRLQVLERDAV